MLWQPGLLVCLFFTGHDSKDYSLYVSFETMQEIYKGCFTDFHISFPFVSSTLLNKYHTSPGAEPIERTCIVELCK